MVRNEVEKEKQESFGSLEDEDDFEEEDPDTLDFSKYVLDEDTAEEPIVLQAEREALEASPSPHPDETLQTGDQPDQNAVEPG